MRSGKERSAAGMVFGRFSNRRSCVKGWRETSGEYGHVGRHHVIAAQASPGVLQETLDSSDIIGRWEWDIAHDRVYAGAAVAHLFNLEPAVAQAGASLSSYLAAVHPDDREKTSQCITASAMDGRTYVQEYRVLSADGVTRCVLARGRIRLDASGRPAWGTGLLIDVTQNRCETVETVHQDLLPLAAEHCLAMRKALHALPEPLLRRMSDMLLLEIGRAMARADRNDQRSQLN
ncbi:PAS domain-containing protein [Methylobacterium sp. J-068]|uniref:PAS domain-containing protein n=1 Tax=Methylobacterium sp. J-068 TaxID=2836649 RepID=UPI001FBADF1F|nr:PAS domain-containing protein [Methylobacterium sp. J-068]MCJ2035785.1 PAS domain-containing protein [Methylobacterium sp. J-068]